MNFPKISNKTVRKIENYLALYIHTEGGTLQKTGRGYFLNGINISVFSAEAWLAQYDVLTNKGYQPTKVVRKHKNALMTFVPTWEKEQKAAQYRRRLKISTDYLLKKVQ